MNGTNSKADDGGSEETNDTPTITQQYSFSVGEDGDIDGEIEPAEESVETDLAAFGADVDHRERDSQIAKPEATTFGVDDRKTVTRGDGGEQHALFADTTDDQQTLGGERAASQCLFESDDTPDTEDREADKQDEQADEAPRASGETTLRAVTDGGQIEDGDRETDEQNGEQDEDRAEQPDGSESVMVAIPRLKLASVADYVEYERNAVERHAGKGPKTQELSQYVEECRSALSVLDDNDENGHISRVVAAGASDELEQLAERHHGEVEQELREFVGVLRQTLDESDGDNAEQDDPDGTCHEAGFHDDAEAWPR